MTRGIIFTACGQPPYFAQACLAAASVRKFDQAIPLAIFTDQPDHSLMRSGLFDHVIDTGDIGIEDYPYPFVAPLLARGQALLDSPFDETLALDIDLRLNLPRLDAMFDMLTRVDLAMATNEPDASIDRQLYREPLYNNGVILYKKTPGTRNLFQKMLAEYKDNVDVIADDARLKDKFRHLKDVNQKKRLLASDQAALAPFFSPQNNGCNVKYAILGDHWNWRGGADGRACAEPVIINHHPDLRDNTWGQLALLAANILNSGNGKLASILYNECIKFCAPNLLDMSKECVVKRVMALYPNQVEESSEVALDILKIICLHHETFRDIALAQQILTTALKRYKSNKR